MGLVLSVVITKKKAPVELQMCLISFLRHTKLTNVISFRHLQNVEHKRCWYEWRQEKNLKRQTWSLVVKYCHS